MTVYYPAANADGYHVRILDTVTNVVDVRDFVTSSQLSFTYVPGRTYDMWVHPYIAGLYTLPDPQHYSFSCGSAPAFPLTVAKNPSGGGTVTGPNINCGADCSESYPQGQTVTLAASAASGYTFSSWSGCDTWDANARTCTVNNIASARTVTANFTFNAPSFTSLTCGSTGETATLGWTSVPSASFYPLRINNLAEGWDGTCRSPSGDLCSNEYGISTTTRISRGASYNVWVHAFKAADGAWSPASAMAFTCINGRVSKDSGVGIGGITIDTCTGFNPVTDANGYYAFPANQNAYCARILDNPANRTILAGLSGPTTPGNTPAAGTNATTNWTTYEWQQPNIDCGTVVCGGERDLYDRNTDTGVDFRFVIMHTLTVAKNPSGGGTVTGPNINCGADCSESYPQGQTVTLAASAASGYTFSSWNGCDTPNGTTCTVSMSANKTATANFTPLMTVSGRVYRSDNTGIGGVTIETCMGTYPVTAGDGSFSFSVTTGADYCVRTTRTLGSNATILAGLPDPTTPGNTSAAGTNATTDWTTYEWQQAGKDCGPVSPCGGDRDLYDRNTDAGFDFRFVSMRTLSVTRTGEASSTGSASSTPAGITCGADCTETYTDGTNVTLNAASTDPHVTAALSGGCIGTGSCTVAMNGPKTVTVTFDCGVGYMWDTSNGKCVVLNYCGSANGGKFRNAPPTSTLCVSGTNSTWVDKVGNDGTFNWICTGPKGPTNCSATKGSGGAS